MKIDTLVRPIVRPRTDLGNGPVAHIVPPLDGVPGVVRAFEARIAGTAVETLCGVLLVPSRDPHSLPDCGRCVEIFCETTGCKDTSGVPEG